MLPSIGNNLSTHWKQRLYPFIFKKSQKVFFCYFTSTHPPGTEAPIVLSYIASQTVDGR